MAGKRFINKTVLVIGAGWGIGEQLCKSFAAEGAKVMVAGHHVSNCKKVVNDIVGSGGIADSYCVDVGNKDEVTELVKYTVDKFGTIDILCNNAQFNEIAPLQDVSLEGWEKTLQVILTGTMLAMQAVYPYMRSQGGGCIVNTGSTSGFRGDKKFSAYCTAKAGIHNLTRCAALDFSSAKIRVNCVAPGVTVTPAIERAFADENGKFDPVWRERLNSIHPTGRMNEPVDIANMYMFLCSEEASNVTGQIITVDGGESIYSSNLPSRDI